MADSRARTPFIPPADIATTAYKALIAWRRDDRTYGVHTDYGYGSLMALRDIADRLERESGDVQPTPVLDTRLHELIERGAL